MSHTKTGQAVEGTSQVGRLGRSGVWMVGLFFGAGCFQPIARDQPPTASHQEASYAGSPEGGAASAASPAVMEQTLRQAPTERPGLGTAFGETRHSPVRDVSFERESDAPMFLASLLYNDAQGAAVQRNRLQARYESGEPMLRYARAGRPMLWGGVMIRVVGENGAALPAYRVDDKILLIGEPGSRYALEVENRTGQRFELVASVDGLDIVDGRTASLSKRGYVVAPYGHLHIDGYRRSMSEVAAFRFSSVRGSYAAQTAETGDRNVGVIGIALFAERGARMMDLYDPNGGLEDEARRREQADPFPGRFAAPPPNP